MRLWRLLLCGALLGGSAQLLAQGLEAVIQAGQAQLGQLEVLAVYEHIHGRRNEKYELRVLLGANQQPFARITLDPQTLAPLPIGLEDFVRPPAAPLNRERVWQAAWEHLEALAISALVTPRPRHFELLLVYDGHIVGELHLNQDLTPRVQDRWLREYERSGWRVP